MSGNEAIARGAYEAGVTVAAGYPGTPSTEILENIVQYTSIKAQWSPNEKVALEVGAGASIGGARALVTMKHVGVNVAADPLFTVAYTGVNGGLLLISADDPGMHSSQNEQDNRYYGKFAKVPVVEPSDSQEAKDFVGIALQISEDFDTPVIFRTTTRVNHSQSLVGLKEPQTPVLKPYVKNPQKYVMVPAYARLRHVVVEDRLVKLARYAETSPLNRIEWGGKKIGVITGGICYQYVKEALPEASVLKLGMSFPLPEGLIREFARGVDNLFVVEELEPFLEEQVRALGLKVHGKDIFTRIGEYTPNLIAQKILLTIGAQEKAEYLASPANSGEPVPVRPPVMCPGCPHRGVFYTLKQLKAVVAGDIGCYTLGSLAPLEAMDTTICMGASIGTALGMEKANPEFKGRTVSVIGDSTFMHSGITGLVDLVYNQGQGTVLILDNSITAMTGHQHNPATGKTLSEQPSYQVDLVKLVQACGISRVQVVDPFELKQVKAVLQEEMAAPEPSVVILRRPCALIVKATGESVETNQENCTGCFQCIKLGCPAISKGEKTVMINSALCTGCGLCLQVCKFSALVKVGGKGE